MKASRRWSAWLPAMTHAPTASLAVASRWAQLVLAVEEARQQDKGGGRRHISGSTLLACLTHTSSLLFSLPAQFYELDLPEASKRKQWLVK